MYLCNKVENLFYNMAARRKTLQNSADDYSKIVDLISRFAIHHINVSFSCRKVNILGIKTCLHILLPQDVPNINFLLVILPPFAISTEL